MPVIKNKAGAEKSVSIEEAKALVASGGWSYSNPADAARVETTDIGTGQDLTTPVEEFQRGQATGQTSQVEQLAGAGLQPAAGALLEEQYSTPGQQVIGAAEGALGVLTASGSDWLLSQVGGDTAQRARHTTGRLVGEIAATVGTALLPFGKSGVAKALTKGTPGGALSKFGTGGTTALGRIGHVMGEGAAYGAAQASTNIALENPAHASESVWSQLGQGAVLGLALGGVAGAGIEGVTWAGKKFAAAKAAKTGQLLDGDNAKAAIAEMAAAHKGVHEAIGLADYDAAKAVKSTVSELEGTSLDKVRRSAEDLHARVAQVGKPDPALTDAVVAAKQRVLAGLEVGKVSKAGLLDLEAAHNALAMAMGGKAVHAPNAVDLAVQSAAMGKTGLADFVTASDDLLKTIKGPDTAKLDKLLQRATETNKPAAWLKYHDEAAKLADTAAPELRKLSDDAVAQFHADTEQIKSYVAASKRPTFDASPAKTILGLHEKQEITPAALKRLLQSDPKELAEKSLQLNKFYADAMEHVKDNPVLLGQVQQAAKDYDAALAKIADPDVLEKVDLRGALAALSIEGAAEVYDGPGASLIRLAALSKLTHAVTGGRGARGGLRRIANSLFRRGSAAVGYGVGKSFGVGGLPGAALSSVTGSLGYQAAAAVGRHAGGGAAKAAVEATVSMQDLTKAAVQRAATGKPQRARAMPLLNHVLNKMLGDSPEASKAKPQEKFKLLQDKLARYNAAPDAIMSSVYSVLEPIQEISEQLADQMEVTLGKQLAHAFETMPKDPGTMMYSGVSRWQPTDRQLREWGFSLMGITHPGAVIDAIADGVCPPQAAQALAVANPELYSDMQRQLLENADAIREHSTKNQRIALGLAFQVPLDPTTDPRYVAFMQQSHAAATMEQAAGSAGEPNTPKQEYTDAQKLLS